MVRSVINYNKLRYFTVVARCRNISRAAQELYIGQPALSTHIRELEEEIGVQLFIRTNRDLILTKAGEVLYERTAAFFEGEEELVRAVRSAALEGNLTLKIGLVRTSAVHALTDCLHTFSRAHSNIEVQVRRYNIHALWQALENGDIDCGIQLIWSQEGGPAGELFEVTALQKGYFLAAMEKEHLLAKQEQVSLHDLRDCAFGIPDRRQEPDVYRYFFKKCRKAGFKPNVTEEYMYVETLLAAVDFGSVVTVTSSLAPIEGFANICCKPLDEMGEIRLCLVRRRKDLNPAAEKFAEFLAEVYA